MIAPAAILPLVAERTNRFINDVTLCGVDAGMTMGHVLLNVCDVAAHREFWTTQFDAKRVTVGRLDGVTIPGVVILFRMQPRTGPSEGTTINHLGLKLNKLADERTAVEVELASGKASAAQIAELGRRLKGIHDELEAAELRWLALSAEMDALHAAA